MCVNKSRIVEIAKDLIKYKSLTGMEKDIGEYVSGFFESIGVEYGIY